MKKTLLLDIDYTIMNGETPRPFLKEFIEKVKEKYNIVFYTAAMPIRVTEVLRIFHHKFGMDRDFVRDLQFDALHRQNCPMIEYFHKGDRSTSIEIKCFKKASEILDVPVEDMIMLDDNPTHGHPNASQIIQAEGFWNLENDDYLVRVLDQLL